MSFDRSWQNTYLDRAQRAYLRRTECAYPSCHRKPLNAGKLCYIHAPPKNGWRSGKKKGHVYFLLAVGTGKVKIGISNDLKKRISGIQVGCPYPLELLCSFEGTGTTEKGLHRYFEDEHCHGEWFALNNKMIKVMEVALEHGASGIRKKLKHCGIFI